MTQTPVLYLVFANDSQNSLRYLREENEKIIDAFREPIRLGRIEVIDRGEATPKQIFKDLETYGSRIVAIHFGGHANSQGLLFENELSTAKGLIKALGLQKQLKFVFLNGCSTYNQERLLRDSQIPITIATTRNIHDKHASEFAIMFYKSLSICETVENAFDFATAWLQQYPESGSITPQKRTYRHLSTDQDFVIDKPNSWSLYVSTRPTPSFTASFMILLSSFGAVVVQFC